MVQKSLSGRIKMDFLINHFLYGNKSPFTCCFLCLKIDDLSINKRVPIYYPGNCCGHTGFAEKQICSLCQPWCCCELSGCINGIRCSADLWIAAIMLLIKYLLH